MNPSTLESQANYKNKSNIDYSIFNNRKKTYTISKRFIDIVGSLLGIIVLSPLFIIIGLVIKIEDPKGSVFFKQDRTGKNGKEFKMYKFRSMVSNAEELLESLLDKNEADGALFKIKDDPRITRVGRFIRRTSIDELPQLWNVLKGEMSLVGPRPPLPREVELYSEYERQKLVVTPGCTGLWQVNGRSNIGFKDMIELDLEYIENRSLRLDLKLIIKTFYVMFFSKGAY